MHYRIYKIRQGIFTRYAKAYLQDTGSHIYEIRQKTFKADRMGLILRGLSQETN